MVKRSAFSMIELIFAIVIIGIAVAGVPQMIARNNQTMDDSTVQEGVFAVAAKAAQLLSYRWDANSQDPNDLLSHSKMLDIVGSTDLNRTNSIFRVGGIAQLAHRRFHSAIAQPVIGTADLDGMVNGVSKGTVNFLQGMDVTSASAYKYNYRVIIDVSYVADGDGNYNGGVGGNAVVYNFPNFPAAVSTNPTSMKMGRIILQQDTSVAGGVPKWDSKATLYVYAANIGEIAYFKKVMP